MKVRIYLAGAIGCYGVGAEYPKLWRKMASEWFEIYSGYAYDYDFTVLTQPAIMNTVGIITSQKKKL